MNQVFSDKRHFHQSPRHNMLGGLTLVGAQPSGCATTNELDSDFTECGFEHMMQVDLCSDEGAFPLVTLTGFWFGA